MNTERRANYPVEAGNTLFSILALGSCVSRFGDRRIESVFVSVSLRSVVISTTHQ